MKLLAARVDSQSPLVFLFFPSLPPIFHSFFLFSEGNKIELTPLAPESHKFESFTYTQPIQCDICNKVLIGFVSQTSKCLTCGIDCHNFCIPRTSEFCNYPRKHPKILTTGQYTNTLMTSPKTPVKSSSRDKPFYLSGPSSLLAVEATLLAAASRPMSPPAPKTTAAAAPTPKQPAAVVPLPPRAGQNAPSPPPPPSVSSSPAPKKLTATKSESSMLSSRPANVSSLVTQPPQSGGSLPPRPGQTSTLTSPTTTIAPQLPRAAASPPFVAAPAASRPSQSPASAPLPPRPGQSTSSSVSSSSSSATSAPLPRRTDPAPPAAAGSARLPPRSGPAAPTLPSSSSSPSLLPPRSAAPAPAPAQAPLPPRASPAPAPAPTQAPPPQRAAPTPVRTASGTPSIPKASTGGAASQAKLLPASFASQRTAVFATGDEKKRADFYDECVTIAEGSGQFLLGRAVFMLKNKSKQTPHFDS